MRITENDKVNTAWAELAKKRYEDLKNGVVTILSWEEIKKEARS